MIRNLVDFALNNRYVVLAIGVLIARLGGGVVSQHARRGLSRHCR